MKKIVYFLLVLIIILPIAIVCSIALMSTKQNSYKEYEFDSNKENISYNQIECRTINEVIDVSANFDSDIYETEILNFISDWDLSVAEGDIVAIGDNIAIIDGKEICSDKAGKVTSVKAGENEITITMKSSDVDIIKVYLPSSIYPYVTDSRLILTDFNGKDIENEFISRSEFSVSGGEQFEAVYKLNDEYTADALCEGMIEAKLYTGRSDQNVLTVKSTSIFEEDDIHYLQILEDDGSVIKYEIELGLAEGDYVEIIDDDGYLKSGMNAVSKI